MSRRRYTMPLSWFAIGLKLSRRQWFDVARAVRARHVNTKDLDAVRHICMEVRYGTRKGV